MVLLRRILNLLRKPRPQWIACAAALLLTFFLISQSRGPNVMPGYGLKHFVPIAADPCRQFHVDPFYPNGPDCR